ncbi:MAG: hypothetical protein AAFQ41_09945 [Cyanobacteria bacterium J06623_7]
MQMLKKMFSSKDKYYLELKDEVTDSEVVQTAVTKAEKTAPAVKEKAQEVAKSEPVQSTVKTSGEAIETAQEKVAEIATDEKSSSKEPSKGKAGTKAKADKSVKAEQNGKAAPQKTKPTPANSGASSFDPPFWVAAMNNTNKSKTNSNGQVAEQTFATDNLLPISTKYRRRPGGSLNKFKDMAKSAKTPR